MTSQAIVDELLAHVEKLPEIPSVAFQVNKLLDDPDTDAGDLAGVIMQDPALTVQVLKICNSAQYGFSRKIGTIKEAVAILGYQVLKRVIFTIISHGVLNRPVEGYALEKGALWENAVTCASYSRAIAQKVKLADPELAFVGALLRDIGKIAMEAKARGHHKELESIAMQKASSFIDAEEQVVGLSHSQLGFHLAKRWNLPDSLINIILYHHQPSQMPPEIKPEDTKLVAVVHLADIFTMMSGAGLGLDGLMYPLDPIVFGILGLKQDNAEMEQFFSELLEMSAEIQSMTTTLTNK